MEKNQLIENLNVLWLSNKFAWESITRQPLESLVPLSLTRANELIEFLGNPDTIFPRRLVNFSEWGALLVDGNLSKKLIEQRLIKTEPQRQGILVNLGECLQGIFQAGWRAAEELVQPKLMYGFRPIEVKIGKAVDLVVDAKKEKVALVVRINEVDGEELSITAQIYPYPQGEEIYLPSQLNLIILDENGEFFEGVVAREYDKVIQYKFECMKGEEFGIKVAWGNDSVTEQFIY